MAVIDHNPTDHSHLNLVPLAEAAQEYGVSGKTLRRRIADGTIHGYRVGRFIRVDMEDLREHLVEEMPSWK